MKEEWEYKKLGEVCTIVGRIGFRGYTKADLVYSSKDGAITLSPSNIIDGELDFSKCTYINWDKYYESPEILLENGDIVLVKTASIGKCAVVKNLPHEATLNPQFVVLKQLVGVPDFICYYLKSSIAQNTIKKMAGGVAIPTLSQKKLGMLIVPTPSQDEQQSIVAYLDSAFAKIDAMKANAEKALNEAKALFQASLKEMLEPKEGWEEKKFGDLVVSNIVGLTRGKIEQGYNKKYPYFKMNNISNNNTLCWDDLISVDANEEELGKYCLQEGDFLFNTRNSKEWVGKSAVYRNFDTSVMLFNNNIMRIRFVDTINPIFIAYSFLADYTKNQLEKIKSGTTNVWAIYYRDLSKILLTFPPLSQQQSIVATLDSLKSKIDRLQENYDKMSQECDALKQAILKQVFE